MRETKFTKGNWYVSNVTVNGAHVPCSYGVACNGFVIASDVTSGSTFGVIDEIQRANAAVMAAAPDMYLALTELLDQQSHFDRYGPLVNAIKNAKAALSKARGES